MKGVRRRINLCSFQPIDSKGKIIIIIFWVALTGENEVYNSSTYGFCKKVVVLDVKPAGAEWHELAEYAYNTCLQLHILTSYLSLE
jgi:hypothetical protein